MLLGYAMAHEKLGLISHDDSFDACFCDWLKQTRKLPMESGWAFAIGRLSPNQNSCQATFEKLVSEFLDEWAN